MQQQSTQPRVLRTQTLEIRICPRSLTITVLDLRTGFTWRMQSDGPGDIGIKGHSGPWMGMKFAEAGTITWEGDEETQHARLWHWPYPSNVWGPLDFVVDVYFSVQDDILDITIDTLNGRGEASFIDSYYPRGFLFPDGVGGDLVLPISQGCLLRKDFPITLDQTVPTYSGPGFVMPWWGHLAEGGEGVIALTDTPDDLGVRLVTDPDAGHTAHPYWQASLGNFSYPRRIAYRFFDRASVVTLAKCYRRHAEERGLAVTLKEKATVRPNVEKLRGGMVVSIWHETYWKKNNSYSRLTFAEGLRRFQRLAQNGEIRKAVVHLDGWGTDGYDFNHPDVLPADPALGGWDGLRAMADDIQAMGHMLLLHDNYVDVYSHTPYFSPEYIALDLSGIHPENNEWLGGRQGWMCPQRTMEITRRTLTEVRDRVAPSGTYLDCMTVSHLRECYDQRHLSSRGDTRRAWTDIFAMCQGFGWATSSEGGADWAIPVLDFCWSVPPAILPFNLKDTLQGQPLGDPIPLYNLVWHDCIVVPLHLEEGPLGDDALWLALWGGIPSIRTHSLDPDHDGENVRPDEEAAFIRSLQPLCRLAERVGFEEMVNLEFLDDSRRVQQTTFSDGTRVLVNFTDRFFRYKFPEEADWTTIFAGELIARP